jgi:hypothetical protein
MAQIVTDGIEDFVDAHAAELPADTSRKGNDAIEIAARAIIRKHGQRRRNPDRSGRSLMKRPPVDREPGQRIDVPPERQHGEKREHEAPSDCDA